MCHLVFVLVAMVACIRTSLSLLTERAAVRMRRGAVRMISGVDISRHMTEVQNAGQRAAAEHAFSVAPMMEYTDAHQRKMIRLLTARSVLYTEMVTANALVRTDNQERFLEADFAKEDPLVLQLGGGDPQMMQDAAKIAFDYGYRNFNINCGCPSEKVAGAGCFGAALMLNPDLVAEMATSISAVSGKPTTVKCRIGVNDDDSYEQLCEFIETVSTKGNVDHFIVHARKALLGGKFSPADNRKIPPLKYHFVYRLARDFPHLAFTLNGGVVTMDHTQRIFSGEAEEDVAEVDRHALSGDRVQLAGVMIGRAIVDKPFHWGRIDSALYGVPDQDYNRAEILDKYSDYTQYVEDTQGARARRALAKPLLGLFAGEPHGKLFRQKLDTYLLDSSMGIKDVIMNSAKVLRADVLDQRPSERHAWEISRALERQQRQSEEMDAALRADDITGEGASQNIRV